jgi:hypothetical protein
VSGIGAHDRRDPQELANKYDYDGKLGVFRLDRALYSPVHYPGDYGFIRARWARMAIRWMYWRWWRNPASPAA